MARGKLAQLVAETKAAPPEAVTRARMNLETVFGNLFYTKSVEERRDMAKAIDALIVARISEVLEP